MFFILLLIVVCLKWVQSQDSDGQGGIMLEMVTVLIVGSPVLKQANILCLPGGAVYSRIPLSSLLD